MADGIQLTEDRGPLFPPAALLGRGSAIKGAGAIALEDMDPYTQRVYVGWGDWRMGERNIFFRALPYDAFKDHDH